MTTLRESPFAPLPLGQVKPAGWLLDQLRVQASGLSGHLDEFWPSVRDSAWVGGPGDAWERGPYWLDGIVPLAVLLDDERLLAKAKKWVDHILSTQGDDGRLGPETIVEGGHDKYDTWPLFVVFKALTQWHSATNDPRVIPAISRALRFINDHIRRHPVYGWGKHRTADLVLSVQWLYERTGEAWPIDLQRLIEQQGYDWRKLYEDDYPFTARTNDLITGAGHISGSHGPNAAMGLKQPALRYRASGDDIDRDFIHTMISTLDRYHGQASGVFTCDEHLAGRSPTQGTELCAVVEYLFSLEVVMPILGERSGGLADRWEQIAYNALPAGFSPDMWAHQYDQQANQAVARRFEHPIWTDNNGEANTFGLEPHFGCCTANMHQGWPKFAAHLWLRRTRDDALVAMSYAPSIVRAGVNGARVTVETHGEYPFDGAVTIVVTADASATVPLSLRVPAWAFGATLDVNGRTLSPAAGTFCEVTVDASPESTTLTLRLPMRVRTSECAARAVVVRRGPVVYSLKIGERWTPYKGDAPHCDYEVFPTTPWNVAIELDPADAGKALTIRRRPAGPDAFSPAGAPVTLVGHGRILSDWQYDAHHGVAAAVPPSPSAADGERVTIELIPFGAAKLRMTELPWTDPR